MLRASEFIQHLEAKVAEQLKGQRVGYLLGAGSSYLEGSGYPLACELWSKIKDGITEEEKRNDIQAKLDAGATGIEHALDLLDDGHPVEGPHRHLVAAAIAELFRPMSPFLDDHIEFVKRVAQRSDPGTKVFNLNYDPLIERAAERARVRLCDGFAGHEDAFFMPSMFDERIGRIRGGFKRKQFEATAKPIQLFKLHGSIGWYQCETNGIRRRAFGSPIPATTRRLMIPPQHRKAQDTMIQPYAALWSAFRGALGQDSNPLSRLVCIGYGFADEHVNTLLENAPAQPNFTLLILTKELADDAWDRWGTKTNVVVVTEARCSLYGVIGEGHPDLWKFEQIAKEV